MDSLIDRSINKAQDILEESYNLQAVDAEAREHYVKRDAYFHDLLGDNMHLSFQPETVTPLSAIFKDILSNDVEVKAQVYRDTNRSHPQFDRVFSEFCLSDQLRECITDEHLLTNTIPTQCINDAYTLKYFRSPKLSKLLVHLFGEKSNTVKWYTNRCPKQLTLDKQDYQIHLSVLPHHIAGMSYYAPLNHGGSRWESGFAGTSCMDPIKNGSGSAIFGLVASLRDENLAVAYLTSTANTDLWNPVYLARALVRVFYINGKPQMFLCKPYYISNEHRHVLVEGLSNAFDNLHHAQNLRSRYNLYGGSELFEKPYEVNVVYNVDPVTCTCGMCGGTGKDLEEKDWDCEECDGEGKLTLEGSYLPYIDDEEYVVMHCDGVSMTIELPNNYLEYKGIVIDKQAADEPTGLFSSLKSFARRLAG